jgi:hypothetical protein
MTDQCAADEATAAGHDHGVHSVLPVDISAGLPPGGGPVVPIGSAEEFVQ